MINAEMINNTPGCLLVALRVRHEDAGKCADKLAAVNNALVKADGFRSFDVIRRDGGLGTDFYILARFESTAALETWKSSPERTAKLGEIERMAIADISRQQVAGDNIWFEPISSMPSTLKPPPLWKRWVTSLLAVYPALIVLVNVLRPITSRLPEALGLFVVALVLTGLTTAYIVPMLSRALHDWLRR